MIVIPSGERERPDEPESCYGAPILDLALCLILSAIVVAVLMLAL